jgi:polyphosphate glucokinase
VTAARPNTLALDIGGTGLKAAVLDPKGAMLTERARIDTTYPMPPQRLVDALVGLATPLPAFDRISIGFPGVVRHGKVLTAPHFVTTAGPGTALDPQLQAAWHGFGLAAALERALGKQTRMLNDADLQGLDVVAGRGVEVVITLGTGVGSAAFADGVLGPHLELAHHPFRKGDTYNEHLGDAARKKHGKRTWNKRLGRAIDTWRGLFTFDHLYIGGGNARHITIELDHDVTLIDPNAGLLGAIRLWQPPTTKPARSPRAAGAARRG